MYKCDLCGASSRHGQQQIRRVVETRPLRVTSDGTAVGSQIVKEIKLCYACAGVKWSPREELSTPLVPVEELLDAANPEDADDSVS